MNEPPLNQEDPHLLALASFLRERVNSKEYTADELILACLMAAALSEPQVTVH